MLKLKLTVNQTLIDRIRATPEKAQLILRRRLVQEVGPELQAMVDTLMAQAPLRGSERFAFMTWKSRKFYFALLYANPDLSDGDHWIRGGPMAIENGFRIEVSDRLRETMVRVVNIQREGKGKAGMDREGGATAGGTEIWPGQYVFGKYAVPGHIMTGWPEFADFVRVQMRTELDLRLRQLWPEAVREAWRT
jgi:hypothetical protein